MVRRKATTSPLIQITMQRCTMKTLLLAIFGLQCSSTECIFETEDLNFFHQVEELYNQVDRATDIEKLLSGEGGGGQLDTLERFCSCQVAEEAGEANTNTSSEPVPLSLLCQAVVWLRLSDDHDHQRLGHGLRRVTTESKAVAAEWVTGDQQKLGNIEVNMPSAITQRVILYHLGFN